MPHASTYEAFLCNNSGCHGYLLQVAWGGHMPVDSERAMFGEDEMGFSEPTSRILRFDTLGREEEQGSSYRHDSDWKRQD